MLKSYFIGIFILAPILSQAQQRQAQVWKYGINFGNTLDFGFHPVKRTKSLNGWDLGASSICDSNGVFQFSSFGAILNRKDSAMPHGKLQPKYGYAYYGCNLIIPFQKDRRKFHYFMISEPNFGFLKPGFAVYRFTIDMDMDGGLGDMDSTKTEVIDTTSGLQIACMLHANGRDSWLITRGYQSDTLKAFLITDSGVVQKVFTDINSPLKKPNLDYGVSGSNYDSQLKSSPDSKMLLIPRRMKEYPYSELLQFDRETGVFSNRIEIPDTTGDFLITNYGDGAFSPDSKKLYYSIGTKNQAGTFTEGPGHFWQFDVSTYDSAAIVQSKIFLGRLGRKDPNVPELRPWAPKMQLAMDGKIYISPGIRTDKYMSTIRCPDKTGANCGLEFRTIDLGDGKNGAYFPTLNQTFVRNAGIFQLQANKRKLCKGDTIELSGYGAGAEHFSWSVSPALPPTVMVDTLTWQKISTATIPAGVYTFSCRATSRCGDVFEKSMQVEILPLPSPTLTLPEGKGTPCTGDSVVIRVQNPQAGYRYFWSTGDTSSFIVVKQSGRFSLDSIATAQGCGLKVSDTTMVTIKNAVIPPVPEILGQKLVEVCEGQKAKLTIDNVQLTMKYKWSNGLVGDSVFVGSGQYSVISESSEGCQSASSDTVRVVEVPLSRVQIVAMDSLLCQANEEEKEYQLRLDHVQLKTIEIQGGELVSQTDSSVTVRWHSVANCQLSIVNSNRLGCAGETATFMPKSNLEVCRSLYPLGIPNLVTLNGDNRNDLWELANLFYFQPVSLQIYNRWGKRIFETSDYRNNWPEAGLEPGTYFYRLGVSGGDSRQGGWIEVVK